MKYGDKTHGKEAWDQADLERGFGQVPEPDFSEESNWEFTENDRRVSTSGNMPLPRGEKKE